MTDIAHRLRTIRERIAAAERRFQREPGSVHLLAVTKAKPPAAVRSAYAAGQRAFGENYVQEALGKMDALADLGIAWHFIGPIQSNKTRVIASRFAWVHSVHRLKIAQRLDAQRPDELPPLNVCLQVNISGESTKSGVALPEVRDLVLAVAELPRIRLRGVMAVPRPATDFHEQRVAHRAVRNALQKLRAEGLPLDTLSLGMTADMDAAIAEGSTMVRIGTAIFGPRAPA